ncbi:MAG: tetratricopeptide repeat protein [Gemmatimonadales bacterium]
MADRAPLDSNRWARAANLFEQLADQSTAERAEALDALAASDPELHQIVTSLLRGDAAGHSGFDGGLAAAAYLVDDPGPSTAGPTLDQTVGSTIGPYRILRELGHGGMGVVFLCEREAEGFRKLVAIKCLASRRAGEHQVRRFLRERRILAGLTHPHIAQMHDGGITDAGEPYLVMEYVEGERLDRWCDERRLELAQRLRLFVTVCDAVQYAHQQLVMHRDLKPGNILVTAEGHVKLLDFGIAKLVEDPESETDPETNTSRALTPDYASPEQLRGDPVTAATDVYSLGVVLFELLTGRRPWEASGSRSRLLSFELDPPRASTIVRERRSSAAELEERASRRGATAAQLERRLRGDLDNILERALAREPGQRYASVQTMLEDLRRHLDGLPVLARRHSRPYLLAKFARRHAVGAAAAAAATIALVVGSTAALWQARVAAFERDAARAEAEKARRVTEFLVSVFREADPATARGANMTAREILDRGARRVDQELAAVPAVRATVMRALGNVYAGLGEYATARTLLERSYEQHAVLLAPNDPELADAVHALAALAFDTKGNADSLYAVALDIRERASRRDAAAIADELHGLAMSKMTSDTTAADSLLRQALDIYRLSPGREAELGNTLNDLALLRHHQGHYPEAERLYEAALSVKHATLGADHPAVFITMSNLGWLRQLMGRYDAADSMLRATLEGRRRVLGPDHPEVARTLAGLAEVAGLSGRSADAERYQIEAMAIQERTYGPADNRVIGSLSLLARIRGAQGRWRAADSAFREAERRYRQRGEDRSVAMARLINDRAALFEQARDYSGAAAQYRRALELYRDNLGARHAFTGLVLGNLATALLYQDSLAAAEEAFTAAAVILREAYSPEHGSLGPVLIGLGTVELRTGRLERSEATLREALRLVEAALPAGHWRIAQARIRLARTLTMRGEHAEAERLLDSAANSLRDQQRQRPADYREALIGLEELYRRTGRVAEAARVHREGRALDGSAPRSRRR